MGFKADSSSYRNSSITFLMRPAKSQREIPWRRYPSVKAISFQKSHKKVNKILQGEVKEFENQDFLLNLAEKIGYIDRSTALFRIMKL